MWLRLASEVAWHAAAFSKHSQSWRCPSTPQILVFATPRRLPAEVRVQPLQVTADEISSRSVILPIAD